MLISTNISYYFNYDLTPLEANILTYYIHKILVLLLGINYDITTVEIEIENKKYTKNVTEILFKITFYVFYIFYFFYILK